MTPTRLAQMSSTAALVAYLSLWPVAIEPVSWQAPQDNGYIGAYAANQQLTQLRHIAFEQSGPETVTVASDGTVATGLSNGDIALINGDQVTLVANTGGRPLGMAFDAEQQLYIADAHLGLLRMSRTGEITSLLSELDGKPLYYANSVAVGSDGTVYLSESSTRINANKHGVYQGSLLDINEHGGSGRVIRYMPASGKAEVVLSGLNFANGVALNPSEDALFVAETGHYRVLKLHLRGDQQGEVETHIDNLPGFPDNLWHDGNGVFWLGLVAPRNALLDGMDDKPQLRRLSERLPEFLRPKASRYGHLIGFNERAEIIHNLQDPDGNYAFVTGAAVANGNLYLSSLHEATVAIMPWR